MKSASPCLCSNWSVCKWSWHVTYLDSLGGLLFRQYGLDLTQYTLVTRIGSFQRLVLAADSLITRILVKDVTF